MASTQLRSTSGQLSVNIDHRDFGCREELVDLRFGAALERADHHLGVDRRAYEQALAAGQLGSEFFDRSLMLSVPGIEERDQHVGVQRYRRHSSRS